MWILGITFSSISISLFINDDILQILLSVSTIIWVRLLIGLVAVIEGVITYINVTK